MKKVFIFLFALLAIFVWLHFKGENIKPIPYYWHYLPYLHTEMASSIYPNIYLIEKEYTEYKSGNISVLTQSVLIHENAHIENWSKVGYVKFPFLYLTSKKFRLEEELRVIKIQMEFLKSKGEVYDIERKAKQFGGKEYGYLLTYEEAKRTLEKMWGETF